MKKMLLVSMVLSVCIAKAQGPQQLVTVPITAWGHTTNGWLYLPQDYHTSNKKYPVVFFYHGIGEAGNNPYVLLNQGIPNLIANGMRPDNITNPVDGQQYSFIVLSVQDGYWSPSPDWLPYELAWLKQNYRIDTNRVYVTGLSAGGQTSFGTVVLNPSVSKLVAAAVPMSPAGMNSYDPSLVAQNNIETWFFTGNSDGTFTANANTYYSQCNTEYPGSSQLNVYSGGHCCWNNYYNTAWHDATTGYSVWEWMLINKRETAQPLPVKFVSLDAKKENNAVRLVWKVAEETNVSHYEVEKSGDGKTFCSIGKVAAAQQTHYSFADAALPSKSFYRIRSVDADGKKGYSTIVKFNGTATSVEIKASPVPATNTVQLQHPTADKCKIYLHSLEGRLLKTVQPQVGTQQTTVDISSLQKGVYYIKYLDEAGNAETVKIVKQ